jgi:UDP-glucose 4-epimerase
LIPTVRCKTFFYVSSVKAAADTVEGWVTEEHHPNPITAYVKSKKIPEAYLLAYLPQGKRVFILGRV